MRLHRHTARELPPDAGSVSLFVAVCVVGLVAVVGIVLDCGGKLRAKESADALAQESARAVGQQLDEAAVLQGKGYVVLDDTALADKVVNTYLNDPLLTGSSSFQGRHPTGIPHFEDGGRTVVVDITFDYHPALLGAIVNTMTVHGRGKATLVHGVTKPENG